MKQTAIILCLSALLVLGAASCKKEKQDTTRFTATMEQSEAKTILANSIAWCTGDQIAVFPTSEGAPAPYTLEEGAGTVSGTFIGEGVTAGSAYYAVYPHSTGYTISGNVISGLTLPAVQTAVAYSFPAGANLMVSQTSTQNFSFKNVCAYIKVTPVEGCTSISVTAPGKKLACGASETFSVSAETGEVDAASATGSATVTLTGTINAGNSYLIAVLPVANADITVTYNTTTTGAIARTYTNKTIARGALVDLGVELFAHEYVDLGLSVKWATCNVGAANPWDYGDYFAWGETEPYYATLSFSGNTFTGTWKSGKSGYNWASYPYTSDSTSTERSAQPYDTATLRLHLTKDAARANWGGSWRMPTQAELNELVNNCTWTRTTQNGVNGYSVSRNGKSIFLPAAGYFFGTSRDLAGTYGDYWSASRESSYAELANHLYFNNISDSLFVGSYFRYLGFTVRPVCE